jgi:hypothetical protein
MPQNLLNIAIGKIELDELLRLESLGRRHSLLQETQPWRHEQYQDND